MRRLVLLCTGALGLVAMLTATAEPSPAATLRITDRDPLMIVGRHFKPGERVRLVVTLNRSTRTHKVRAGSSGTFRRAFEVFKWRRCSGTLKVEATGSRGSRAGFTLVGLACADAPRHR
jgi:hypothetical protein